MMPRLVEALRAAIAEGINGVHTAFPGTILSVYPEKCAVDVLPALQMKTPGGSMIFYPKLRGVPILLPASGGGCIFTPPIKAGDMCLVVVCEQSLDLWRYNRQTGTDLKFDISNAVCIPGLFRESEDLREAVEDGKIIIRNGELKLEIADDEVRLKGNLHVDGDITASGTVQGGVNA